MKRTIAIAVALLLLLPSLSMAQRTAPTADVVRAANAFLATLSAEQRKKVLYAFDDAAQRVRWTNLPTGAVPRGGMSLVEMTMPQRAATMKLLATVLSPMGLEKVNEIREADEDFSVWNPDGHGVFGADHYYISFLGTPSATEPWMLQFGGHHLGLNVTIAGSKGVSTPMLTGAQPATFKLNGKVIRPLGRESDKAITLLKSLDANQRKVAVLKYQVPDLVLGPGQDGKKIVPEGLKASEMYPLQQAMLLDLIAEWTGILNGSYAAARMTEMKADLNETYFAWSGPQTGGAGTNITAYYRIQGPHLVIEYAPQSEIQPPPTDVFFSPRTPNHVHTIYRDPTDDYGSALLKP
jgi:hypothetical protein